MRYIKFETAQMHGNTPDRYNFNTAILKLLSK